MITPEELARHMAVYAQYPAVQIAQTRFRMQLVKQWQIPPGSRVLEIGCGQGDMTAVLANAVGSAGYVTAVDIADPAYGAPITLGQSARHLLATPLGRRIDFRFNYDVLNPSHTFPSDTFDYVVLAHCSWYFESFDQLRQLLQRVKPWTSKLCYAEWDLEPQTLEQVAHLLAVLIQGHVEAYKATSDANVRTPFSKARLKELLHETAWIVSSEAVIDTTYLQDARWEIDTCLASSMKAAERLDMPLKIRELLRSQVEVLRLIAGKGQNRPLPAYALVAERGE